MRLALALLLLAPDTLVPEVRTTEPIAAVSRLLDDRASAFRTHDRALLARTLRPGAFADSQLRGLDNAADVRFAGFTLSVDTQYGGDIASPRVKALYPNLEVTAWQVREETQIEGGDAAPYVESSLFTFVRERADPADPYDGWRMVSGSDFEVLGAFSAVHIWDGGRVSVARSEHFLVLTHPDQAGRVGQLLEEAEASLTTARAFWPRPAPERYVIVLPSTTKELGAMLQSTFDLSKFVAFAAATSRRSRGFEPAGVRIYIQLSHYDNYDKGGRRDILEHELIHALTRPVSGPFFPNWVEEGLAMYGAEGENGLGRVRRRGDPDGFPADEEFFVGPTSGILHVYYESQTALATLAHHFRNEGVAAFYEALGQARLRAGTERYHVARALEASVGWTETDWLKAWQARI